MTFTKLDTPFSIDDSTLVRCKEMGNITEIMYSQSVSNGGYITKLDKDNYIDNRSGEIMQFSHNTSRADDIANVAKSLGRGRDIINANVTDVSFCRWLTLTYRKNMTDPKKLRKDFDNFNTRCRKEFGHYEYITAAEPQGRGAWHLHVLLLFDRPAPFMPNNVVSDCWKQGFVNVRKLDNVDNVGAYLTAYLGDMELSEAVSNNIVLPYTTQGIKDVDVIDDSGNLQSKRYVKGARLHMYPAGFHIFRYSKGIKKPVVSRVTYSEAKEKASSAKLTYSKTIVLEDPEKDFKNTIHYEYYNSTRK